MPWADSGKRVLRVFPDYSADPVWDTQDAMVDLDTLGLSSRLVKALRAWAREWERLLGPAFEVRDEEAHERWLSDGRRLAERLQEEVGPSAQVVFAARRMDTQ